MGSPPYKPQDQIPLGPPLDNASECLEEYAAAANVAYEQYKKDVVNAKNDLDNALAWLNYLAASNNAYAAYFACMGQIPPSH